MAHNGIFRILKEETEIMKEKRKIEVSEETLEKVSGGQDFGTYNADKICNSIGHIYSDYPQVDPPKYPCPKCGSWNVGNYDPGSMYQMRVYCKDCGFFGCRDGGDDIFWGNDILDELKGAGLVL